MSVSDSSKSVCACVSLVLVTVCVCFYVAGLGDDVCECVRASMCIAISDGVRYRYFFGVSISVFFSRYPNKYLVLLSNY